MSAGMKMLCAVALFCIGVACGRHDALQAGKAELATLNQSLAEQSAKAEADARTAEQKHAADIAAIDARHQKEMNDAKATADRVAAGLRAGNLRLRAEWSCTPALAAEVSKAAAGAGSADGAAELRAKGAGDLIGNADEADATVRGLQAVLKAERQ